MDHLTCFHYSRFYRILLKGDWTMPSASHNPGEKTTPLRIRAVVLITPLLLLAGCAGSTAKTSPGKGKATVLVSVTSDATKNPQAVDMAMKLAGFSLDEGRQVAMFFNVKGVKIPVNEFPADFAFGENKPLKEQIADLIKRGAEIHVCPICMKALGVEKTDLMEGAVVTTRPKLFDHIGADTSVFTY